MAEEETTLDIPIYLGMGEETDSQAREGKGYVSENTRFRKTGSVSSVTPLTEFWERTTYADINLLPTVDDIYAADSRQISRLEPDGQTSIVSSLKRPFSGEELEVALGRACMAWPQAAVCGDEIVVTWLEVDPEFGYLPYVTTLSLTGDVLSPATQVLVVGAAAESPVAPKYSLTKIDNNSVVLACVTAEDSGVLSPTTEFWQVRLGRSGRTFGVTGDVYHGTTGGDAAAYVASCYDGTNMYHITYSRPAADTSPWTAGPTTRWIINPDGTLVASATMSFSASSFAALAHQPTTGDVWCLYRGYDAAGCHLSEISGSPTAPVALNNTNPWFKSTFSTSGAGTTPTPHTKAVFWQFSRMEDGFIFFDSTGNANIVAQGQGHVTASIDSTNLIGFSVWRLGTSIAAGSAPEVFPGLSFTGGAWVDDTDLHIPAVERAQWTSEFADTSDDPAVEFMYFPTPAEVSDYGAYSEWGNRGGTSGNPTTHPLFPPAYSVACVAMVSSSGRREISSYHHMDEATDHTGLITRPNRNGLSSGVPNAAANYRCLAGSVLSVGGEPYLLASKQVGARLVGGNGRGGYEAEDLRLEGWGCSIYLQPMTERKRPRTSATAQRPVIGYDLISTLSGGDVVPTALPTPPVMSLNLFTGTGADTFRRSYKFLWCYIDEEGIRHRGPPSPEYRIRDENVDRNADSGTFRVQVPAAQLAVPADRFLLEVYANPIVDGAVEDTLKLVDTLPLGSATSDSTSASSTLEVPYSYADTTQGLPLLYTEGGVLPNEARPTTGPIAFNRQRVWSFDGRRLFFSKTSKYLEPFSFNSNLYFDSPDGSDFTGVASLDEQTVAFTRTGVYLNRGQLPNDLGAGGSTVLHHLNSPTGCKNAQSVVESPMGVFFQGERGVYLLSRELSVEYIGFPVEDTLDSKSVDWGFYDKGNNEVVLSAFGVVYAYNTLVRQWSTRVVSPNTNHGAWHPAQGTMFARSNRIYKEQRDANAEQILFPFKHSTPWVATQTSQGFQRVKRFSVQGRVTIHNKFTSTEGEGSGKGVGSVQDVDPQSFLTVRVFVDHNTTPAFERYYDLRALERDPFELDIHNPAQKCRAVRLEFETLEANVDLRLTSVVALLQPKRGTDKRQITSGS